MKTYEEMLSAYKEAKAEIDRYMNYKGDKRSRNYRFMRQGVSEIWIPRLNNFAKKLNLPTYQKLYFE